jgi:sortase (surface protein transpeptidase)
VGRPSSGLSWVALTLTAAALFGVAADPAPAGFPKAGPGGERTLVRRSSIGARPTPQSEAAVDPLARPSPTPGARNRSVGHILIPAIGVDAKVIPLGLASDGSLEVPLDYGLAGWWTGGPFPGEPGPAVIVGHVDSKAGPAVFYWLRALRPGDRIIVWRAGEARSRFVVDSMEWYAKAAFPTRRVYGPVPGPALRLITCGGAFDHSTGHYVDNLVVFAVPET